MGLLEVPGIMVFLSAIASWLIVPIKLVVPDGHLNQRSLEHISFAYKSVSKRAERGIG